MSTLLNYSGEDELYHGRSFQPNSMAHVDAYVPPRKRSRISAPFNLWGSDKSTRSSVDVLPNECLFEILRRLPSQERSICACVSKHWLTLLSSTRKAEFCHSDDTGGLITRSLEGKRATDIRLAAIAVKIASRGGLEKLSINSTHGVTSLGISAIARGSPSLKSISLWNVSYVDDEGLVEVANECRMLERLDLCQCPLITNKGLIAIAEKCPNLTSLSIESCPNVGNDCFKAIAQSCPKLESVSIKDCPLVGDQGVASLLSSSSLVLSKLRLHRLNISDFSLAVIGHYGKSLTSLTLNNLGNVSEKGFWVMGKAQGLKSLASLSIASCLGLTDLSLEIIAKSCSTTLKQITLRNLTLSDNGMLAFSESAKSLESLNLEDCNLVTLYGILFALSNQSSKLKSLSLVKCMSIKDIPILETPKTLCQILRSISIKNCPGFGGSSLMVLSNICPSLRHVDLSGCINLSDESIQSIAKLHGESLKVLNLNGCRRITDLSLSAIAKNCSILHDLDISNCTITDSGIASLSLSDDLNLQILSISGCSKISNKSLPVLLQLGKNLIGLNLKHCTSLSAKSINTIIGDLWRCDILS